MKKNNADDSNDIEYVYDISIKEKLIIDREKVLCYFMETLYHN